MTSQLNYPSPVMTRTSSLGRSAQILMWSSPLLLLVLVFTLSQPPMMTVTKVSTSTMPTTKHLHTRQTVPSVTPKKPSVHFATLTTPSEPLNVIAEQQVAPPESLSGVLAPQETQTIPLVGPGTWSYQANGANSAQLFCPTTSYLVSPSFVLPTAARCQLVVTSLINTGNLTWHLTPTD